MFIVPCVGQLTELSDASECASVGAMRTLLSSLLLLVCLCVAAPPARARDSYDSIIKEALAEYDRGNWVEARALFRKAHALQPNARALRGAAAAAYGAKRYVAAYLDFNAALASTEHALTPAQRAEVSAFLERVNAFLVRMRLTLEPASAELEVDGGKPVLEGGELLLDPGAHELVARAEGRAQLRTQLDVEGGERRDLTIALPTDAPPSAAAAPMAQAAPAMTTAPHPQSARSPWPWVAAGGAISFAGSAIALYLAAIGGASEVERACPADTCTDAEIERRIDDESIETYQTLSGLSWVLAGAGAALSVTLFMTDTAGPAEGTSARMSVTPGGARLSGRF